MERYGRIDVLEKEIDRLIEQRDELLEALITACGHIEMSKLEISHCKDAGRIRSAIAKAT